MNFDARNWGAMINIMSMNCQEPPCTTKISDEDLVAMTTSTSYVWEKRHRYIVAKSVLRNQRKAFKTKKDYH